VSRWRGRQTFFITDVISYWQKDYEIVIGSFAAKWDKENSNNLSAMDWVVVYLHL